MRTTGLALLVVFALGAQTPAEDAKRADVRALMGAIDADRTLAETMKQEAVSGQMRKLLQNLTQGKGAQADALVDEYSTRFAQRFIADFRKEIPSLIEEIAVKYDAAFTHEEIRGMIDFYRTPLGKKVLQVTPSLAAASMAAGQSRGEVIGKRIGNEIFPELIEKLKALPKP
jgi:hypothetical protein